MIASPFRMRKSAPKDQGDEAERQSLIAEILAAVFGRRALDHVASVGKDKSLAGVMLKGWDALKHPRSKNGRFIEKNSAEAVSAAHDEVAKILKGPKTSETFNGLLEHLNLLTVKQLHDLKGKYKLSAAAPTRDELAAKLAERLGKSRMGGDVPEGETPSYKEWAKGERESRRKGEEKPAEEPKADAEAPVEDSRPDAPPSDFATQFAAADPLGKHDLIADALRGRHGPEVKAKIEAALDDWDSHQGKAAAKHERVMREFGNGEAAEAEQAASGAKQPYEMTADEYADANAGKFDARHSSMDRSKAKKEHARIVADRVLNGQDVPAERIAEYPHLDMDKMRAASADVAAKMGQQKEVKQKLADARVARQKLMDEIKRGSAEAQAKHDAEALKETLSEYLDKRGVSESGKAKILAAKQGPRGYRTDPNTGATVELAGGDSWYMPHYNAVKDALAAGKPVPPEVLADYPDLAAKYAPKASETSGEKAPPVSPPPPSEPPQPPSGGEESGGDKPKKIHGRTPIPGGKPIYVTRPGKGAAKAGEIFEHEGQRYVVTKPEAVYASSGHIEDNDAWETFKRGTGHYTQFTAVPVEPTADEATKDAGKQAEADKQAEKQRVAKETFKARWGQVSGDTHIEHQTAPAWAKSAIADAKWEPVPSGDPTSRSDHYIATLGDGSVVGKREVPGGSVYYSLPKSMMPTGEAEKAASRKEVEQLDRAGSDDAAFDRAREHYLKHGEAVWTRKWSDAWSRVQESLAAEFEKEFAAHADGASMPWTPRSMLERAVEGPAGTDALSKIVSDAVASGSGVGAETRDLIAGKAREAGRKAAAKKDVLAASGGKLESYHDLGPAIKDFIERRGRGEDVELPREAIAARAAELAPAPAQKPKAPTASSSSSSRPSGGSSPGRITISGNTFAHKDRIRAAGGKWDADRKVWVIDGSRVNQIQGLSGLKFSRAIRNKTRKAIPTPFRRNILTRK